MELRLLGPLEVVMSGTPVPVPAGKPRSLLILLALRANEPIATDRIVDALWGEDPPPSAPATVQTYISRLRKLLGADRIETVGHSYRLRLDVGERDVDRVEALRDRSRTEPSEQAARTLRQALALFRGRPLADVADADFARVDVRHLEDLRDALLVERIEADLAAGSHAVVLGELVGLIANRPYDERLRELQMLALYRSGRQADALAAYQATRSTLADELGLEPSAELRALQRRILEHDPTLVLASRASDPSPRRGQRFRRKRALVAALAGYTAVIVAAGMAAGVTLSDDEGPGPAALVVPNSVAIVDPRAFDVVGSVSVGREPRFVAADADAVWVAAVEDRDVTRIDARTFGVTATIDLPFEPTAIEAIEESVWVAGSYEDALWRLDSEGVPRVRLGIRTRFGPPPPGIDRGRIGLASSEDGLWFAYAGAVWLLDPVSGHTRGKIEMSGGWLHDLDVGPIAVVESLELGGVESFHPRTLALGNSLIVGRDVSAILIASGYTWVAKRRSAQVWQLDGSDIALRRTIEVEGSPVSLAFLDDKVWVVTQGDPPALRRLDVRDGRLEESLALDHTPEDIAATNELLWIAIRQP